MLDITGGDEDTVRAVMAALEERWAASGIGPVRPDPGVPVTGKMAAPAGVCHTSLVGSRWGSRSGPQHVRSWSGPTERCSVAGVRGAGCCMHGAPEQCPRAACPTASRRGS
ncbi:DUF6207 family protein [Streptomyces sp. NBC_00249]|uniref:DUF6207 family protein n=1 Tax=Streptomyces sp. NBC_00249 TaxID=2975690 RepID=UPI002258A621|nr:DUF6207 family protein [Streptomyces sp. NBC_00249]MCX5192319.1 DUF6207 family protein [Streptomyces sp. NBC_00249]